MPPKRICKTVLLAEDNNEDFALFEEILGRFCPTVKTVRALDGEEAVQYIYANRLPDLVVLDIRMPRLDGLDALAEMRKNPLFKSIPVIILSSVDNPDERAKAAKLGCKDYLLKPTGYGQLVSLVQDFSRFGFEIVPA